MFIAEQLVDDPVRSGGLLLGSLPEQDSTALVAEQLVHNPVRGGGLRGTAFFYILPPVAMFMVHAQTRVQQRLEELNILFLVEVFMVQRFLELNTFIIKIFPQDRVQQRFAEMEDLLVVLKTLSRDKVQQHLVEQMMLKTSSGAAKSYWSTPAVSTRFPLRRKVWRRRRRRRRRSRWTLRSSPHASKAIFAPGATVPPSSEVVSVGGARRALSRTRMTSSTRMYRDISDGLSSSSPSCSFL